MSEIFFWLIVFAIVVAVVFGVMTIDDNRAKTYFIEKVKCTIDDENINYTFKKTRTGAFSTAEDGAVNIRDEQGYPIRTLTDATCDITYKRMIDNGDD